MSRSGNCPLPYRAPSLLAFPLLPWARRIAWRARAGRYILQRMSVKVTAASFRNTTVQSLELHDARMQKAVHVTLGAKNQSRTGNQSSHQGLVTNGSPAR
ncbi:hypothetical protein LX36DRAFT_278004 [Colletotrichum falcatum]|nr:hypothetical protein LX36DRAFT_278004 [Colletotrichum falcatum]